LEALQVNAKDMALLELAQFTDARICVLLGVPPFLMALPSGDSMTYSNVEQVFEYHDRSQLRTEAVAVMTALSGWALPRGQNVELDREEYSRPPLTERVNAYKTLVELGAMSADEIRPIERTFFAAAPAIDSPLTAVNGAPNG
jgi:phage portal protein BeeE